MPKTVAIVGTLDTKGEEFAYLRGRIESAGLATLVIDCGVLEAPAFTPDIARGQVATAAGQELEDLLATRDRGSSIAAMAAGAEVVVRRLCRGRKNQGPDLPGRLCRHYHWDHGDAAATRRLPETDGFHAGIG